MVKISIQGTEATIQDYQWASEDKSLADILNAMLPTDGPTGFDPDPDYSAAQVAAAVLDGEIIEADDIDESNEDEDVIY